MNKLDEALGLFPSVIKSGENWSPTCQAVLVAAKEELKALRSGSPTPGNEWRDIETAPKEDRICYINRFGEIGHCSWSLYPDDEPCWWDHEHDYEVSPIGWMPQLPAPPAPSDGRETGR